MDAADLRARIEAGLTFRHLLEGGVVFTVCLPTRNAHDQLVRESLGPAGEAGPSTVGVYRFELVARALRGWENICVRDLWPEHEEAGSPLPFGVDTARLLMEERTDWLDRLYVEIARRVGERAKALEADRGNSPRGSAGSGADPTPTSIAAPV